MIVEIVEVIWLWLEAKQRLSLTVTLEIFAALSCFWALLLQYRVRRRSRVLKSRDCQTGEAPQVQMESDPCLLPKARRLFGLCWCHTWQRNFWAVWSEEVHLSRFSLAFIMFLWKLGRARLVSVVSTSRLEASLVTNLVSLCLLLVSGSPRLC